MKVVTLTREAYEDLKRQARFIKVMDDAGEEGETFFMESEILCRVVDIAKEALTPEQLIKFKELVAYVAKGRRITWLEPGEYKHTE